MPWDVAKGLLPGRGARSSRPGRCMPWEDENGLLPGRGPLGRGPGVPGRGPEPEFAAGRAASDDGREAGAGEGAAGRAGPGLIPVLWEFWDPEFWDPEFREPEFWDGAGAAGADGAGCAVWADWVDGAVRGAGAGCRGAAGRADAGAEAFACLGEPAG